MLCSERKTVTLFLTLLVICAVAEAESNLNMGVLVRNLLTNMERSAVWDENLHFALIFSDFIIKRK